MYHSILGVLFIDGLYELDTARRFIPPEATSGIARKKILYLRVTSQVD